MKGYNIDIGYVGYINGKYYLFASEAEYIEMYLEYNKED